MSDNHKRDVWKTIALSVWSLLLLSVGSLAGTVIEGGKLKRHADLPAHREAAVILEQVTKSVETQSQSIESLRREISVMRDDMGKLRLEVQAISQSLKG